MSKIMNKKLNLPSIKVPLHIQPRKHVKLHNPIEKHFDNITLYHFLLFTFLFLSKIPITWHIMSIIFVSPPMKYQCAKPKVIQRSFAVISHSTGPCPCEIPEWDKSVFTETLQSQFNVKCDDSWQISFSESAFSLGLLFGALSFGFLSDKYGRLITFTASNAITAIIGCIVITMPTLLSFIIMRCFEGFGAGGTMVTGYVLCIEYTGVRHREAITAFYHIPINVGHITLAGVSYFLRDYRFLLLTISITSFLAVFSICLFMESPKWLMDNDHIDKAAAVMERFCAINKTPCENIKQKLAEYHLSHIPNSTGKANFCEIFKHKKLTINLMCMSGVYFICGLGYYGLTQYIGQMSGNIHANVAISGAITIPGTISSIFLLKYFRRKTMCFACFGLAGFFIFVFIFIPSDRNWAKILSACLSDTFFFMGFVTVYLYSVELYPTSVRNSALGFLSFLSRLGQIVAPPMNTLPKIWAASAYAGMGFIGVILCIPLPETKNTELPSSFEESEQLTHKMQQLEEDKNDDEEPATSTK